MCGIFGYGHFQQRRTNKQILDYLITGLKRLEYRGYDSAGVCIDNGPVPVVIRQKGNVDALRQVALEENKGKINLDSVTETSVGIAHTRWATHGEPCERNAHPHSSKDAEFILCHNGIMTNYAQTKAFLIEKHGYVFVSDTDTEVVAQLFHYVYHLAGGSKMNFVELTQQVMEHVDGAYALIVKSTKYPGELLACKKGSPLIVGIPEKQPGTPHKQNGSTSTHPHSSAVSGRIACDELFISSDANAIAEHTKKVAYMEDNDIAFYAEGYLEFFNSKPDSVPPQLSQLDIAVSQLSKGKYEHFMLKEIYEQNESVMTSMRGRINFESKAVTLGGFIPHLPSLKTSSRLVFISCGTSLNACYAVRPLFDELVNMPINVENASDFLDRTPFVSRSDACIFVSQSGETADTLRALEYCRDRGATLIGFTNVVGSSISRSTHFGAHLNAGVEVGVASTKAYTSQIIVLTLLALLLSADSVSKHQRRIEIINALATMPSLISDTLNGTTSQVKNIATDLVAAKSVIVLGRGFQYASCLEAALKIKELTYVHTEGINSGELKHGPLALIDADTPVIAFCTKDALLDRAKAAVQQVRARKGKPIVVASDDDIELKEAAEVIIKVPQTVDCLQCIINILPMQLLSYHLAVLRGNNVDCPRNLAKSVTVQ
eukprot:GILI01000429.1.p1 GENE.GILI01000429.1~~GILI01000429.1.p1  ORF type:complete len:691 (+),score=203.06 GILI01000429.1:95-2074(+)